MVTFKADSKGFQEFTDKLEAAVTRLSPLAKKEDTDKLRQLITNFNIKTEDFYRENRKLNIGVVGQVKAGKSSFLNTLLFGGREILPKASTPKTATLTKMEYSERNVIKIEYYSPDEWQILEDNALIDLDDEIYTSARELVEMVRKTGFDPTPYLKKGEDEIEFAEYDDLISHLNDYVGEDGKFTPIVKAVTLSLNNQEFQGLSIVDTPGLNDPIPSRTIRTKDFMELCDVVFFLSQSVSFLDKSDWELLSSQLPQKGVKKLVLIASKYDSGIRDILRVKDEDDIFGDDDNTADNIPQACKIIKSKLTKRAKTMVKEFVRDLEARESSPELIEVVRHCEKPVMASAIADNMCGKSEGEYSSEEKNMYAALKQFSRDMDSDLKLLGNFDEVRALFEAAVADKEQIMEQKAKSFIPNAKEELRGLLTGYKEKTEKRIQALESNDREQLLGQKKLVEERMKAIEAGIAEIFGELNTKLETEKVRGIRELREASKDYLSVKERTGTITHRDSYTTGFLFWKKKHYYTYDEHYSYCTAADAVENIKKYSLDAANQVEEVFTNSLQLKEIKRKLVDVGISNIDMGSEKFDASLLRIVTEETVNAIEFPIFNIDVTHTIDDIAGKFSKDITSVQAKTELSTALSNAISRVCYELSEKLSASVKAFREEMTSIGNNAREKLLSDIADEFDSLLSQCENKEKEIAAYREYAAALENELEAIG